MSGADTALGVGEQVRLAVAIADRAVLDDIRSLSAAARAPWWDTRPMLDEYERAPHTIDIAQQALSYAELRGLIRRHPEQHYLVRIAREPLPLDGQPA